MVELSKGMMHEGMASSIFDDLIGRIYDMYNFDGKNATRSRLKSHYEFYAANKVRDMRTEDEGYVVTWTDTWTQISDHRIRLLSGVEFDFVQLNGNSSTTKNNLDSFIVIEKDRKITRSCYYTKPKK